MDMEKKWRKRRKKVDFCRIVCRSTSTLIEFLVLFLAGLTGWMLDIWLAATLLLPDLLLQRFHPPILNVCVCVYLSVSFGVVSFENFQHNRQKRHSVEFFMIDSHTGMNVSF